MQQHETVIYQLGTGSSKRIAAFDLDSTLIVPGPGSGRKKAAASTSSWNWWNPAVPDKLRELQTDYTVVIFSNQSSIFEKPDKRKTIETKIEEIVSALGFQPYVYISGAHDRFRKPATGMWELFLAHLGHSTNKKDSYYVGDAAGRSGDHSNSDANFAHNMGVQFYTPEMLFLDAAAPKMLPNAYDQGLLKDIIVSPTKARRNLEDFVKQFATHVADDLPCAVFMIGPPASGKSTLADAAFPDFIRVSQDELKTKSKTQKAVRDAVAADTNFVIDKTFGDATTRAEYLALVPKTWTRIAVVMDVTRDLAEHLNWVRAESQHVPQINDIVYATYYKYWTPPTTDEGFDAILHYKPLVATNSPIISFMKRHYV